MFTWASTGRKARALHTGIEDIDYHRETRSNVGPAAGRSQLFGVYFRARGSPDVVERALRESHSRLKFKIAISFLS